MRTLKLSPLSLAPNSRKPVNMFERPLITGPAIILTLTPVAAGPTEEAIIAKAIEAYGGRALTTLGIILKHHRGVARCACMLLAPNILRQLNTRLAFKLCRRATSASGVSDETVSKAAFRLKLFSYRRRGSVLLGIDKCPLILSGHLARLLSVTLSQTDNATQVGFTGR